MPKRKRKPRPTYTQHSEASYEEAIRNVLRPGDTFWDYLTEARLETCSDTDPIKRAEFEGARKFIERLQDIVLAEPIKDI